MCGTIDDKKTLLHETLALPDITDFQNELSPENFHFILGAVGDLHLFDNTNTSIFEISLMVGKGGSQPFYEGELPLRIGARLYRNAGTRDKPIRGDILGEFRAESEPFTLPKGRSCGRMIEVTLPSVDEDAMVLEIGLVKEGLFWLSDIGHPLVLYPIVRHHAVVVQERVDTNLIKTALGTVEEQRVREARHEAIIVSLLNLLSRKSD